MGDYVSYQLSAKDISGPIARLRYYNVKAAAVLGADGESSGKHVTWKNHEKDLRSLSSHYPGVLFVLHGWSSDYNDVWVKYFLNGKMQHESIGGFDEKKLT